MAATHWMTQGQHSHRLNQRIESEANLTRLIDELGFRNDPFAAYVAENEPDIDRYYVRPPYYSTLEGKALGLTSFVLFGARGSGKSAARLAIHRSLWAKISKKATSPLVVTLDSFTRILSAGPERVSLSNFVSEVGFLLIDTLLVWLAHLPDDEREVFTEGLDKDEERLVLAIAERFYLSVPELVRTVSTRNIWRLLDQDWSDRAGLFVRRRWDQIATLVASIAGGLSKRFVAERIEKADAALEQLLKATDSELKEADFARAILGRLSDCARAFGFSGLVVLVDKVDETPHTSNSFEATARLLFPLLATVQALEVPHLAWAFFLWDRLREPFGNGSMAIRLDKVANATIVWDGDFLVKMIDSRVKFFSQRRATSFGAFCATPELAGTWLADVILVSQRSPRELIRALDTILREHDNKHASADSVPRLSQESFDHGLDVYAMEQAESSFRQPVLRQLFTMNRSTFINKDVQSAFRINDASARNRIRAWVDAGLVAKVGERPVEGGGAGKPAHEFQIADSRVRRIVERGLASRMNIGSVDDEEPAGA